MHPLNMLATKGIERVPITIHWRAIQHHKPDRGLPRRAVIKRRKPPRRRWQKKGKMVAKVMARNSDFLAALIA